MIPYRSRFDGFHAAGLGVEDVPRPLRQQQILGERQHRLRNPDDSAGAGATDSARQQRGSILDPDRRSKLDAD